MKMSPAHKNLPGRVMLRDLLSERNQHPERIAEIDQRIREQFEQTLAVLVLDMVGFSSLSAKLGIISYLAMIANMVMAARPAVESNGGKVLKLEADNLFATFKNSSDALEGALDIQKGFNAINGVVPDERDIYGSIGIGFGPVLVIDDEDFFGCEVNLASKLGEDIAASSEILLTRAAFENLPAGRHKLKAANATAGSIKLDYYRYVGLLGADDH